MQSIVSGAWCLNQAVGQWSALNVINLESLLAFPKAFNQPLNNWNVCKIQTMDKVFYYAISL
jgi:hypothetical protein